ncbi:MAG: metal ABC transporter substrate-binding protein [Cyanobium sp. PLM2.Bin73]|nr:MAG: metal ABC transporter substrate-binding protein [Cyanobium sp. PLM2.Bin73]
MGLTLALAVVLAGCGPRAERGAADSSAADAGAPLVLTSFTVLADMASEVACGQLRVESITRPGAEIHGYDPTPSDLRRAQDAQLVLVNGLNLELWMERYLASARGAERVVVSEGVDVIPISGDAGAGQPNPHAWMSPRQARTYVANIRDAFIGFDPANADTYRRCADAYSAELEALDGELREQLAVLPPDRRLLVSCEGALSYLAADYGLEEAYLWPVNAETEVTPQRMERVIRTVRERQVPAVFCESTVDDRPQRRVAEETGARFGGVFYVDSLSEPDGVAPTYLAMLRHNARILVQGLRADGQR